MPFIDHRPPPKDLSCKHPQHNPPSHIVLRPGTHVYQCPKCGATQEIHVREHSF